MFLHYILKEEKDSLISRFFETQARNPGRNDWVTTVRNNLDYLEIWLDFEQIEMCSEYQFRKNFKRRKNIIKNGEPSEP